MENNLDKAATAGSSADGELKRIARQNAYLSALHETAVKLLERLDEEELLEAILQRAAEMTVTEHGFIYLLGADRHRMSMRLGRGFFSDQIGLQVKMGEGLGGRVWQCAAPVIVERYRDWEGRLPDAGLDPLLSVVGIPLISDTGVLGVIGLGRVDTETPFDEEDVTVLSRFAVLALMALDKARLYADVSRELAERRKAEAILRKSQERYKNLLEASPDPVVVYDIKEGNIVILRDVTAAKKAEQELKQYRDRLEELVQERTAALAKEVDERRRVTGALRKRERELKAQSQHLEEVNTALKVLLQQREEDRFLAVIST